MRTFYLFDREQASRVEELLNLLAKKLEENYNKRYEITKGKKNIYIGNRGREINVGGRVTPVGGADDPQYDAVPDVPHLRFRLKEYDIFKNPVSDDEIEAVKGEYVERLSDAVTLIQQLYELLDSTPSAVYGLTSNDIKMIREVDEYGLPITQENLTDNSIEYFPWLVIFPPPLVETYGRDRLLDSPAWITRELADNSILVVSYADIFYQSDYQLGELQEHLGLDNPASHLP